MALSHVPFSVPVGCRGSVESWSLSPGFRTGAQFERVRETASRPDFAFACNPGMFEPEPGAPPYRGPVTFLWYDRGDRLHADRIRADGRLSASATA